MKKVIPFKKEIVFNTNIYEINSISLEHSLKLNKDNLINGEFIISGDYKENESVINNEPFIFNLPCNIDLDNKYNSDKLKIEIDDFNYEILNKNTLEVDIMVGIDGVELEKDEEIIDIIDEEIGNDILDDAYEEINNERNNFKEEINVNEEVEEIDSEEEVRNEDTMSIFNNFDEKDDKYVTYHVHIFREEDTIDGIIKLYDVNKEELSEYNDIEKITIGSKIIIPNNAEV